MRALDLFGGRKQVQRRLAGAIRDKLLELRVSDIRQLEESLNLRQGTVHNIVYDESSSLPSDVLTKLNSVLGISMLDILGPPEFISEEDRTAWEYQSREHPFLAVGDGASHEMQSGSDTMAQDRYVSLRAMAELASGEGLESTVPEEFKGLNGEFDLNEEIDGKPFIEVVSGVRQEVVTAFLKNPKLMHQMEWREFEEFIANIFDGLGFTVELTSPTKDGGRDIIAIKHEIARVKYLIECKQYDRSRPVGVGAVRSLLGVVTSEHATKGILAATSGFTKPASQFIETNYWRLEGRDIKGIQDWLRMYNRQRFGI